MKYHTGHTKMYCTKWQHNTRYMIKKYILQNEEEITHPIQWRVQNNNTIQAIQIRYKTNITHYTQSWTYNTILKIQYTATLRKKHFCSVENGSHTLTDKRAAHDNGLHLQSDTHTIHIRKGKWSPGTTLSLNTLSILVGVYTIYTV